MFNIVKDSSLIVMLLILTLGCTGVIDKSEAQDTKLVKEMKIKRLLKSEKVKELQQTGGSVGVIKVGEIAIGNAGTRGETAIIQVLEHSLVSWKIAEPEKIEIRRYTSNSDKILKSGKFFFTILSSISGSNEFFRLEDFVPLSESEVHSINVLVNKEFGQQ